MLVALFICLAGVAQTTIPVETNDFAIVFETDARQRLHTVYTGKKPQDPSVYPLISRQYFYPDANAGIYNSAYTPSGTWSLSEPALQVTHHDGNASTELVYKTVTTKEEDAARHTIITLADPVYQFTVELHFRAWPAKNVLETWSEIVHTEKAAVTLHKYASANLYFNNDAYYLTHFQGEYLRELQPAEERLSQGMKVIESKLGTRTMLLGSPNFILSLDHPAAEDNGTVLLGQLAWTGNYKLEFDIDSYQNLRLLAGINPYASAYTLQPGQRLTTPSLILSLSNNGTGQASRQLHSWARQYRVLNGTGERLTLLNNWEATYFDFDEAKLSALIGDTKKLGLDLFLLDDGWFGNNYPRNSDNAGLGDWQENRSKLPHGLGYLVQEAANNQVRFGVWIEPEMVNPKSDLINRHPDWVIRQPQRDEKLYRNQLVLDLSNPAVQDFVFGVVDSLFIKNPQLAFIKWDCNAVIYNAYSPYLARLKQPQSHLYVDYVQGLYSVLERIRKKYPKVSMMLCSGGGGRADYTLLKYFTEFWPSDNTEPLERIFLQWNYSYFFPSIATDCHVTNWGKQPLKFRIDVASMGKLGFDIVVSHLSSQDLQFAQEAVRNYNLFKPLVYYGDQYRLASPYDHPYASLMYANESKTAAVMFTYLHTNRFMEKMTRKPIPLKGLDAGKKYRIKELNLQAGTTTTIDEQQVYTGAFLMHIGINPDVHTGRSSVVLYITEAQ